MVLAVTAAEPSHGYAIAARLRDAGIDEVVDASLYPVLKKLQSEGALVSDWDMTGSGPPRRVYSITDAGWLTLTSDRAQWRKVRNGIDEVFNSVGSPQ